MRPSLDLSKLSPAGLGRVDWNVWRPRLGYAAFFLVAFVLAFRWTFPVQALKERLILEASARGWQVDAADVGPAGIVGMSATDVVLEDHAGTKVALDEVSVSFRLLPLLIGRKSVAFDVRLWDGRITGIADVGAGDRRVEASLEKVDLARAAPLRQALKLELLGTLSGSADVTMAGDAAGKSRGRVELAVTDAGINGGQLPLPGMSSPLTIPKIGLGKVVADVVLAEGKGTFDKLEARDGDAELRAESLYFVPQARLAASPLYGKVGVRVADAFLDKNAAFKGLLDLALRGARGKDGFYQLQLYGSLGSPQARPVASGSGGFPSAPGPGLRPPAGRGAVGEPGGPITPVVQRPPPLPTGPEDDKGP